MEKIANQLKQARIDKGYSLEETVRRTKFTMAQLKAIESANLTFFENDLSYFSYIIRYYANALDYDYELLRPEVEAIVSHDEFTQEIQQISQKVPVKINDEKTQKPKHSFKKRKQIDYSFLAFLFSSILLVLVLLYVGINYVPKWFKEDPVKKPDVIITEDPTKEDEEPEKPQEPEVIPITTSYVASDPARLEVKGWEDDQEIEIKLVFKAPATWISASVNNVVLTEPLSKTYVENEEISVIEKVSENKEIMFHLGKVLGNEFYINGERVALEENLQNSAGVEKIYFKFVKDGNQ